MLMKSIALLLPLLAAVMAAPATQDATRLIKLAANKPAVWMSEAEVRALHKNDVNFMDITYTPNLEKGTALRHQPGKARLDDAVPAEPTQVDLVRSYIATANKANLPKNLFPLTQFHNRYYKSKYGVESSDWWCNRVQETVDEWNKKGLKVTVSKFKHANWPQTSCVARIEGKNNNPETVVMGAHQDSINSEASDPMDARAPGADDDGSGSVTQLEAFRVLLENGYQPTRAIEFQWYAGEEEGLLGAQDIADHYKADGRIIAGMMQLDMTGYPEKNPDVGIQTDFTTPDLTELLRNVVKTYSKYTTKDFKCGYACSDHGAWFRAGYPTARPAETSVRPLPNRINMHSTRDTVETVSYDHMMEYVKIALGWVVEMSH